MQGCSTDGGRVQSADVYSKQEYRAPWRLCYHGYSFPLAVGTVASLHWARYQCADECASWHVEYGSLSAVGHCSSGSRLAYRKFGIILGDPIGEVTRIYGDLEVVTGRRLSARAYYRNYRNHAKYFCCLPIQSLMYFTHRIGPLCKDSSVLKPP